MNDTTITNIFNSDNSNMNNIKTQRCHTVKTITSRILKFKPIIKNTIT